MNKCTEERFLSDVSNHQVTVISDDGVNRHIRFREPGTICYGFDLITWPWHLCIAGDCGTYVFSRINDMFEFFRIEPSYAAKHPERKLFINAGYWGEKLLSIGTNAGYKEFDEDNFKDRVTKHFNDWKESQKPTPEQADELWDEIESTVLSVVCDGPARAYQAAYDFEHDGFLFEDFFDGGSTERYTFHYLWCLYAINWGISQYDAEQAKAA